MKMIVADNQLPSTETMSGLNSVRRDASGIIQRPEEGKTHEIPVVMTGTLKGHSWRKIPHPPAKGDDLNMYPSLYSVEISCHLKSFYLCGPEPTEP